MRECCRHQSTSCKHHLFEHISQLYSNNDNTAKTLLEMCGSPRQAKVHHVIVQVMSRSNRANRFFINNDRRCYVVSPIYSFIKTICLWKMTEFRQTFAWRVQRIIHCSEWICKHVLMFIFIISVNSMIGFVFWNDVVDGKGIEWFAGWTWPGALGAQPDLLWNEHKNKNTFK